MIGSPPARAVDDQSWSRRTDELDRHGCALTGPLVTASQCDQLTELYAEDSLYRSTIDMERYRFGKG